MNALVTLWKFSRPHTLIGSAISICTIYMIVCHNAESHFGLLALALTVGITCNIFITGLNQVADVAIDRINKPYLPIPAGKLRVGDANVVVCTALLISLGISLFVSPWLFGIVALSSLIGWAYSMPPFHLKRHHIPSAIAISSVRGILLNAGGFVVFNYIVNKSSVFPDDMKILTAFIIVFSIVISWFKDLPDMEGDARYNIKTFAILYSAKTAFIVGHVLLIAAYVFTLYFKYSDFAQSTETNFRTSVLLFGHLGLLILFVVNALSIDLQDRNCVRRFYRRFWFFFFGEYAVYFIAYV